jgi:AAHS family 4-hydroxybenzoate transporter-like MFS transporter
MPAEALPQAVQVADIIDRCRFRGLPLVVSLFTVLTFVFDGFDIQGVAFVAPELLKQWGIARAALGPVLAAGLVGMAAGSLLLGPLGDRIGRRSAMAGSLLIVAAGSLASAFASSPGELVLYRFITGVGIGGSIPSATALMMEFAPVRVRNLAVSITVVGALPSLRACSTAWSARRATARTIVSSSTNPLEDAAKASWHCSRPPSDATRY